MKTIEDIVVDKICDIVQYVLSKIIKPDITVDKVADLDIESIKKLKKDYQIEGIILDVDETLRKEMNSIPKCNQEWIENLKDVIKIIIVSNGYDPKIENYFKEKGIEYIGFAYKPLKYNFKLACKKMEIDPNRVLVVGDRILDDIYGGQRNNMKTVLVKNVEDTER